MTGSSTSATPSFRCQSYIIEKKMNNFEFEKTHYTQKGILPIWSQMWSSLNPVATRLHKNINRLPVTSILFLL